MKQMFLLPRTKYTSFIDKDKFYLNCKIFLFLTVFFLILSTIHFIVGNDNFYATFSTFIMSILVLASLKYSKKYNLAVIIVFIFGTAISQHNIYTGFNVERIVDLLWMICISVYIFYMFGAKYGIGSLAINIISLIVSLFLVPEEILINSIKKQTTYIEMAHSLNILVATFITGFIIRKIIKYSNYNEKKLIELNNSLRKERDEKTIMLQEIHHRVKNNLQIISSLLKLQSYQLDNTELNSQFRDAINRISSMALIHEKIYKTDSLSNINIKEYLESLINDIVRAYSFQSIIETDIRSNVKDIKLDNLIPIALIFNELITNSIKHGFKANRQNKISILINKKSEEETIISYLDNGVGFKTTYTENFGSSLIDTFTEQLNGNYTTNSKKNNGIEYLFKFKNLE